MAVAEHSIGKRRLGAGLAMGIVTVFLLLFYSKFIFSPNSYLFAGTADGAKAYYVYAYHIKHDSSYHQLEGMNYPYGQTYIYTDGQPVIANTVKLICSIAPGVEPYTIGIYNIIILLSFLITGWLLYRILLWCKLPPIYAGIYAGLIAVMSPQYFRLTGHMTLTYTCFFPLLWLLLINYYSRIDKRATYTLWIILSGIFWGMIHPYYLPAQTFFIAAIVVQQLIIKRKGINKKELLYSFLQIVIPFIVIKTYTDIVDIHTTRPEHPSGFFDYVATWKTIFLPAFQYLETYYLPYIIKPKDEHWEGTSYIGIVANLSIIITILYLFVNTAKRQWKNIQTQFNSIPLPLQITIIPAVLLLLLAMAIPFNLNPFMAKVSEHVPYLRQFRSLGRFAWPFFYVITVYAAWVIYQLYHYFTSKKKIFIAYLIVGTFAIVFCTEGYLFHYSVKQWMASGENYFKEEVFKKQYGDFAQFNWKGKYQAAISIPFFRIGSENYYTVGTDESMGFSFGFSYHTGIPLMASSAARTPSNETADVFQFFAPDFEEKAIEKSFPNKQDFLVLYSNSFLHSTREREFIKSSTPIVKQENYSLLAHPFYFNPKQAATNIFNRFEANKNQMVQHKGFYFDGADTTGFCYFSLDTFKATHVFEGAGALESGDEIRILTPHFYPKLDTAKEYTFSIWHYNENDDHKTFIVCIEQADSLGNNGTWKDFATARVPATQQPGWNLLEYTFKPQFINARFCIVVPILGTTRTATIDDEIMLRPAATNVYKPIVKNGKPCLIFNNYRVFKP